jgi:hypothetical protein
MISGRDGSSKFAYIHNVDQNCNYLQEGWNNCDKPSYARPSNYRASPDDREGNWGSRGFILDCHNSVRDLNSPLMLEKDKMPDTKHHTMAWIQDQNKLNKLNIFINDLSFFSGLVLSHT